ncbi:MAG: hypothetical protein AAB215_09590, partial [Planctomycetota bacterium]
VRIASLSPADGSSAAGARVEIRMEPAAAVDPHRIAVFVAGRTIRAGDPGAEWNPRTGVFSWDALAAGSPLPAGKVSCRVRAGGFDLSAAPVEASWAWTRDLSLDKVPPPSPALVGVVPAAAAVRIGFEGDDGDWGDAHRSECRIEEGEASKGRRSLRIGSFARVGQPACFYFSETPLPESVRRIAFDYRASEGVRLEILRGKPDDVQRTAHADGFKRDGRWHRFEGGIPEFGPLAPSEPVGIRFERMSTADFLWIDDVAIFGAG